MGYADLPAETDAERILAALDDLKTGQMQINSRLDTYRDAINMTGENITWLCQNTKGLFEFLQNPALINQMMGSMLGGMSNAGPEAAAAAGIVTGSVVEP